MMWGNYQNTMRSSLPHVGDLCFSEIESFEGMLTNPEVRAPRLRIRVAGQRGDFRFTCFGPHASLNDDTCALAIACKWVGPARTIIALRDDASVSFVDTGSPGHALAVPLVFDDGPERHDPHYRGTEIATKPSGLELAAAQLGPIPDVLTEALEMTTLPVPANLGREHLALVMRLLHRESFEWLRAPNITDRG